MTGWPLARLQGDYEFTTTVFLGEDGELFGATHGDVDAADLPDPDVLIAEILEELARSIGADAPAPTAKQQELAEQQEDH